MTKRSKTVTKETNATKEIRKTLEEIFEYDIELFRDKIKAYSKKVRSDKDLTILQMIQLSEMGSNVSIYIIEYTILILKLLKLGKNSFGISEVKSILEKAKDELSKLNYKKIYEKRRNK